MCDDYTSAVPLSSLAAADEARDEAGDDEEDEQTGEVLQQQATSSSSHAGLHARSLQHQVKE